MQHLKMALFTPAFDLVGHTQDGDKHTFKFETRYINVDMVACDVRINGNKLKGFFGSGGHRYVPIEPTNELVEIFAVSSPGGAYQPYNISVTMTDASPHLKDFLDYWKKNGKK